MRLRNTLRLRSKMKLRVLNAYVNSGSLKGFKGEHTNGLEGFSGSAIGFLDFRNPIVTLCVWHHRICVNISRILPAKGGAELGPFQHVSSWEIDPREPADAAFLTTSSFKSLTRLRIGDFCSKSMF